MAVLLGQTLASAATADLVIFTSGHVQRVDSYTLEGDKARMGLPSGGVLVLPLLMVERVVDDEIDRSPAVPEVDSAGILNDLESVPETPFGELIFETASRHLVSPALVAAMVRVESAFDPRAVSPKGASGLMQLMPATADRFGLEAAEIFEPQRNLEAGVRYLKWLSQRYAGDLPSILAGYNAGEATVDRYGGVPPFRETRDYIRKIYGVLGLEPADAGSL